jgi:hypothetical protein
LTSEPELDPDVWAVFTGRLPNGNDIVKATIDLGRAPRGIHVVVFREGSVFKCSVEFNPGRFVDPWGIGLCRPEDLRKVVRRVMNRVSRCVTPYLGIEEFQVRRIDVSRNFFGISHPARYFHGLRAVPKPRATFNRLLSNPVSSKPETLEAGSKSGGKVMLYDKYAKAPDRALPATLRFEIRAHQSWLKHYGNISTLADVTKRSIHRLALNRAQWFGLEAEVMTFETACDRILDDSELSTRVQNGLMRYVLARLRGNGPQLSSKTAQEYRRTLKRLGIAPYRTSDIDFAVSRLDFKTGTEIRVA